LRFLRILNQRKPLVATFDFYAADFGGSSVVEGHVRTKMVMENAIAIKYW